MSEFQETQVVAQDEFLDGAILVSTIYLPESNSAFPYESIVVVANDWMGAEQPRYATQASAQEGHQALVDKWSEAKPAYCFECAAADTKTEATGRGWILANGDTYCRGSADSNSQHHMCPECLPADACAEHPNWCLECAPGEPCELHREGG